ncbi:FAD-dependent oxidoreductase [Methylobacterium oryzae CBMB20]
MRTPRSSSERAWSGLSTALYLRRAGRDVTVIDPLPPGGGASYGNAGMISADTASPIAMPGMLRQVPGWLRDRKGPLVVHPSYFPTALPWLMRWIKEGRMERVLAISGRAARSPQGRVRLLAGPHRTASVRRACPAHRPDPGLGR